MKIAVVGGSNSVLKDSYVSTLRKRSLQIDNKAIGMTNSMYALLQVQKYNLLQHNDLLIHEYFVNDNNHFFQGINSPERAKKTLLTIIHQCIINKKKLLIIMIYNRADKISGKYSQSPIFTIYTDLIKQYDIPFIDMYYVLYMKVANKWPLYYRDDTHLSLAGMAVLSDEVLNKLQIISHLKPSIDIAADIYEHLNVVNSFIDKPILDKPTLDKPTLDKPILDKPILDKPIIKSLNNSLVNISYLVITESITLNFDRPTEILAIEYVCDQRSGYVEICGISDSKSISDSNGISDSKSISNNKSISDSKSISNNKSIIIQKNTLKTERLVVIENKPIVSCITFNTHLFEPVTTYTITMIHPKDLHPNYYDRERNTYETLHERQTNFKIASLLVTNKAKLT